MPNLQLGGGVTTAHKRNRREQALQMWPPKEATGVEKGEKGKMVNFAR